MDMVAGRLRRFDLSRIFPFRDPGQSDGGVARVDRAAGGTAARAVAEVGALVVQLEDG